MKLLLLLLLLMMMMMVVVLEAAMSCAGRGKVARVSSTTKLITVDAASAFTSLQHHL